LQDLLAGLSHDALLMMWPQQSHHIPDKSSSLVVYDIIDDSSLVPNANETWHAMHKKWILCADIVTATADILLDQASQLRSDVISLPNAVRLEDWQSGNAVSIPQDIKIPRNSRVVVGYYGALAEWMDWQMWEYAAQAHQDWSFVLIGPSYGTYRIPPEVQNLPNLFFLGPKPYHELPAYLSFIDVVTIPFLLNDITHACSPVKLFEYMASGKPIVATPMREILKYHSVMFAGTYEQFVTQLEAALAAKSDPEYQRELQQEAEANTWRARAVKLRDALITSKQAHAGVPRRQRNKDDCSGAY
jgi:glycosyltransferase involved in cell wall biosynthesis